MAALLCGETSHHGAPEANHRVSQERPVEEGGGRWYFSRKELEEKSPSRLDGIDLKKETYLRKSYCTFLQDLGMRLKVPQVTIATAIIFCHRFFLRQSHAKNDRRMIATVCMFLAGKVEETPRPLKDVILVSYEIIHKKDAAAVQKIKQKEVYEQQKELLLVGERVVLGTLGYDLNVHHPYKPLVEAIKKFKVAQNTLAQVAWNFVNDGLRTSLCLQFKPHHIAAGAIFLAANFLEVNLPTDGDLHWRQEFDVTSRQLEELSNQMLELYEQTRPPQSQANNEAEGSAGGSQRAPSKDVEHVKPPTASKPLPPSRSNQDHSQADNQSGPSRNVQSRNDPGSSEITSVQDHKEDDEINKARRLEREMTPRDSGDTQNKSRSGFKSHSEDGQEGNSLKNENCDNAESKGKYLGKNLTSKDATIGQSPQNATKKLDREKIKAALERRKAARGEMARKSDPVDELERELEDVEVPSESEKKHGGPKQSNRAEHENQTLPKRQSSNGEDIDPVEDGELEPVDDTPKSSSRKRKLTSPLDRSLEEIQRDDYVPGPQNHHGYSEREHKRQLQENHV